MCTKKCRFDKRSEDTVDMNTDYLVVLKIIHVYIMHAFSTKQVCKNYTKFRSFNCEWVLWWNKYINK